MGTINTCDMSSLIRKRSWFTMALSWFRGIKAGLINNCIGHYNWSAWLMLSWKSNLQMISFYNSLQLIKNSWYFLDHIPGWNDHNFNQPDSSQILFCWLPSGKLTWQWKMNLLKIYSLLKMGIFHCYVCSPEGKKLNKLRKVDDKIWLVEGTQIGLRLLAAISSLCGRRGQISIGRNTAGRSLYEVILSTCLMMMMMMMMMMMI